MQQIFQIPTHHPQLDANVPQKCKHAIQGRKSGSLWLRKGPSSNSSNVDWICGLNLIHGEKIVGCWVFFFPKREIIPSYTLLKTESHKTEKGGAKAEALSLLEEDPSNVVWSSSGKHCCICLLLSVVLSGQLSAGGSFSFSWSYPTVIKKISYTAYLLNSQFALEDSQAEPECIWGAE